MKKLFTLVSLTALFLVVACKKAEVFPVSANDTVRVDSARVDSARVDSVRVDSVRVDTTQVSTGKSDKVLLKEEDTSL
jgi:uncharacterized protein YcfL